MRGNDLLIRVNNLLMRGNDLLIRGNDLQTAEKHLRIAGNDFRNIRRSMGSLGLYSFNYGVNSFTKQLWKNSGSRTINESGESGNKVEGAKNGMGRPGL